MLKVYYISLERGKLLSINRKKKCIRDKILDQSLAKVY